MCADVASSVLGNKCGSGHPDTWPEGWEPRPVEAVAPNLQEGGRSSGPLGPQCEGGTLCPGGCVPAVKN